MFVALIFCVTALGQEPGVETGFESLWAKDLHLIRGAVSGEFDRGDWKTTLEMSTVSYGVDYEPNQEIDPFTVPTAVNEWRHGAGVRSRWKGSEGIELFGGANGSIGFGSHRSIWINEWYRQWFEGLAGLRKPNPFGVSGSLGLRWEYLPASGFIEAEFTYARDHIAPGYDEVFDPAFGLVAVTPLRSDLNTRAGRLTFENVLTKRVRSLVELRLANQSERGLRWSGLATLHYAVARAWVLKAEGGYTLESLDGENVPATVRDAPFEAWWIGGAVERQLGDHWYIGLSGRLYEDNGEIESSISFSSAAPAARIWQAGMGIRWVKGPHAAKVFAGPYRVDHDEVDFQTLFFKSLYRDRTFLMTQLAYSFSF